MLWAVKDFLEKETNKAIPQKRVGLHTKTVTETAYKVLSKLLDIFQCKETNSRF